MTSLFIRVARPGLMALLLLSTAPLQAAQTAQTAPDATPTAGFDFLSLTQLSATGAYMAGQEALTDLRTEEAARYFGQAAIVEWGNPVLVERAFIAYAADGQIGQAASTAKHLLDLDPKN